MWDRTPGQKNPRLFMIGTSDVPMYLYRLNDGWALFEGGLSSMAQHVLCQIQEIVSDLASIKYWFITHSHYDHCALVPHLSHLFPNARIVLSERAARAFTSVSAQRVIRSLNKAVAIEQGNPSLNEATSWEDIPTHIARDGETIELDNEIRVLAVATPGHSRCSMSYLLEPDNFLLVSDALGEIVSANKFLPLIFDNADDYLRSLKTINNLQPDAIGLGHHGIITDSLARSAANDALHSIRDLHEELHQAKDDKKALTAIAEKMTITNWPSSSTFLTRELHLQSMTRMIGLLIQAKEEM